MPLCILPSGLLLPQVVTNMLSLRICLPFLQFYIIEQHKVYTFLSASFPQDNYFRFTRVVVYMNYVKCYAVCLEGWSLGEAWKVGRDKIM